MIKLYLTVNVIIFTFQSQDFVLIQLIMSALYYISYILSVGFTLLMYRILTPPKSPYISWWMDAL
jgi:hypothetical protein